MSASPATGRRIALVLGGGGMKGFAHIGVLRALEEAKIVPDLYAGTSIGAMIAASYLTGTSADDLERRARALRRRDVFRVNHFGVLLERMGARSIYLDEPLRELCEAAVPDVKFSDLKKPLLVNTVDVDHGARVVWGLPGLDDISVRDAVYASCALPGFFPPGEVAGRTCIDGGVVDNLPVSVAANFVDLIVAVDVGSSDSSKKGSADGLGFAATYMRAATMMMHALQQFPLEHWQGPPMVLIRPKVDDENWLSFASTESNIAEGYRSATSALKRIDSYFGNPGCVYPRRRVQLAVDQEKCVGCELCVSLAPPIMRMNYVGKAEPIKDVVDWSPAEGGFVHECPVGAISADNIDRRTDSHEVEQSRDPSPSAGG